MASRLTPFPPLNPLPPSTRTACNGFFAVPESASAQDDPSTKDPQAVEYRAQVLDTAGVQYVYPKGLRSFLWRRSFGLRLRACAATVGAAAFAVLRISFGVLLLLSLAVVVAVMLVLIARAGGAAGDRHSREGLEGAFRLVRHRRPLFDAGDLYWWMWWREWWLQNPFFYGWDAQQQHRMRQEAEERRRWVLARLDEEEGGGAVSISRASSRGSSSGSDESAGSAVGTRSRRAPSVPMMVHHRRAPTAGSRAYDALEDEEQELEDEGEEDMSFFESVFSLLFGDGRPGPSENERWQRVGRLIHDKRGVVVAEEVVPLLTDAAEADLDRRYVCDILWVNF